MFPYIFAVLLIGLLMLDYLCLPRAARRAWFTMAGVFGIAAFFSIFQAPLSPWTHWLGIGRPVDLFLYLTTAFLVREFFLSRIRYRELQNQLTQLTRSYALAHPGEPGLKPGFGLDQP